MSEKSCLREKCEKYCAFDIYIFYYYKTVNTECAVCDELDIIYQTTTVSSDVTTAAVDGMYYCLLFDINTSLTRHA